MWRHLCSISPRNRCRWCSSRVECARPLTWTQSYCSYFYFERVEFTLCYSVWSRWAVVKFAVSRLWQTSGSMCFPEPALQHSSTCLHLSSSPLVFSSSNHTPASHLLSLLSAGPLLFFISCVADTSPTRLFSWGFVMTRTKPETDRVTAHSSPTSLCVHCFQDRPPSTWAEPPCFQKTLYVNENNSSHQKVIKWKYGL